MSGLALATLLGASSLTVMAGATIAPALPAMAEHFAKLGGGGVGAEDIADAAHGERVQFLVRLALTGPGLFTAIVSLLAGPLVDRLGRLTPLLAGLVLYVLAGTSGLYLNDLHALLVGRALLGAAVALVMVSTTALIADLFVGPERQRVTGLQSAAMSFGGVLFLVCAGLLADVSWRMPFVIYLAALLVLAGVVVSLRGVSRPAMAGVSKDANAALSTAADPGVVLVGALLLLGFVGMVLFYMIPTHLPFRLQEIGVTQKKFGGFAIALNGLVAGLVAMQYPRIRRYLPFAGVSSVQFGFMAAGYLLIASTDTYAMTMVGCAINGLGQGFMLPNIMSWIQTIAPPRARGKLTGFLVSSVFLGQFLSPIVTKPLGDRFGLAGEFRIAALVMIGLAVVMGLLAALGKRNKA